jgi:UDP-N-acetylglucosamine:LPS N-acetylglucosamine transferase
VLLRIINLLKKLIEEYIQMEKEKLCLVCSSGGHLEQMKKLGAMYSKYPHFFISFKNPPMSEFAKKEKTYFIKNPQRQQSAYNPLNLVVSFFQSFRILLKEKPDFIISTGAGIAVPVCYLAKLFGKKIIFIASAACIAKLNLSSRIMYPIADLFFIQYEHLAKKYPKAVYRGNLYDFC